MKNKRKKIYAIIIVAIVLFITTSIIKTLYFPKKANNVTDKLLELKWLIMDKDKTPENITINDTFNNYFDSIMMVGKADVPLQENDDYYYADIRNYSNEILLNNITDFESAIIGTAGVETKDVTYNDYIITIPKKYYSFDNVQAIQAELQTRITQDELASLKTKVTINGKTKTELINGKEITTRISIADYGSKKNIDNMEIYLNGSPTPLTSSIYTYDKKTNVLEININPVNINKIFVKNKSFFKSIFGFITGIFDVNADTPGDRNTMPVISLQEKPNLASIEVGDFIEVGLDRNYVGGEPYDWGNENIESEANSTLNSGYFPWGTTAPANYIITNNNENFVLEQLYSVAGVFGPNSYFDKDGIAANPGDLDHNNNMYFMIRKILIRDTSTTPNTYSDFNSSPNNKGIKFKLNSSNELATKLLMYCVHPTIPSNGIDGDYAKGYIRILDVNSSNMTVLIASEGQITGDGQGNDQAGYGVFRFDWPDTPGEIKVQKEIVELDNNGNTVVRNATSEDGNFTFDLYTDSSCTTKVSGVSSATTVNGIATFSNLPSGAEYYVKEQETSLITVDTCKKAVANGTTAISTIPTVVENFLFLGDSITVGANGTNSALFNLGNGNNMVAAQSNVPQEFIQNNLFPSVSSGNETYNGIVLETGYNNTTASATTPLLDTIRTRYPDTPIYVIKMYKLNDSINSNYTAVNAVVDSYNSAVASHCSNIGKCYFVDNTTGTAGSIVGSDGKVLSMYTNDGVHLNRTDDGDGYYIYRENLRNKIESLGIASVTVISNEQTEPIEYKNAKKYYCLKVVKRDAEKGTELKGFKFDLTGKTDNVTLSGTTDDNGSIIYNKLSYQKYKLEETSEDGTTPTGGNVSYWTDSNNNANNITIDESQLTIMELTANNDSYSYTCPNSVNSKVKVKTNHKQYYCIKVKKVDGETGEPITGAKFKAYIGEETEEHVDSWDGEDDGYTTFFTDTLSGTFNVKETEAPEGYEKYDGVLQAKAKAIPRELSKDDALAECNSMDPSDFESTDIPTAPNYKKLLIWYKVSEDGTKAVGAEFNVFKTNGTKIYNTGKADITDSNGVTKNCYVGTTTATNNSDKFVSDANGEVCVYGLTDAKYDVTETKPAKYHTFGNTVTKRNLLTSTSFKAMDDSNKWTNYKTVFEFTKNVSSGDDAAWKTLTTNELKKIPFVITDDNGNILSFIKTDDGEYEFSGNTIDKPTENTTTTTKLYLDDNRKFKVYHLPLGTYHVKENVSIGSCDCSNESCVGYYGPTYNNASDHTFVINECSNDDANSTVCSSHSKVTKSLTNIPTEISFTKKDLYSYEDASDIVDFENDQERNDFDKIVFKVKDSNGNYMKFVKVGNTGTCLTDNSYAEYRYVSESEYNLLSTEQRNNLVEELHTCGGHIKITHLCRGKKYYIEEISVPTGSVFTLPEKASDRVREYNIPCCGNEETPTSSTAVINDKGTRVRFEKRDSKYNYLIPDETTTFNVYQCELGTECHPTVSTDNVKTLVKFSERAIISNDEEDINDAEGIAGVEVYNAMSDSDVESGKTYVTDVHPYHGILVLRYLPSGYNYVLVETVAPKNYMLPSGLDAETEFTVSSTSVSVKEVDMPNVPTSLIIRKYDNDGKLLTGAEFRVYVGTTCDKNLSAMNQPKTPLHLKTIRDGVYENRPITDTYTITTCSNKNGECSSIPVDETTKLTYTDYLGTWSDFSEITTESGNGIELLEGEALIQYLEYGHCYIIEEVKAPKGYSLPENEEDRFTMVNIDVNEKYAKDTNKALVNTPTPFTFYKFDENNNLIDGAEFKLQKLNNNLIYEDLTVTKEEKNGEFFYKVDKESTNKTITTKDGKATVYYLEAGQYRILETKAAPGNVLGKNPNIATFYVDDNGNVHGNSIITNKPKTEKIEVLGSSSAEYVIGIKTGKAVVKYGLIFMSIICTITVLMIFIKKRHKGE